MQTLPITAADTDLADIFPRQGRDTAAEMRRLAVVCGIQRIAREIWQWGPRATTSPSLHALINYHGADEFRFRSHEVVLETLDRIAAYVPGGLAADVTAIPHDDLRAMLEPCIREAREAEQRIRARMRRVV